MRQRKSTLELIRLASQFDDLQSLCKSSMSVYQALQRRPEGAQALKAMFSNPTVIKTPKRTLRDCLDLAVRRDVFDPVVYAERFPTEHNWLRKEGLLTAFRKQLALTKPNHSVKLTNPTTTEGETMKHEKTAAEIELHKNNIYVSRFMSRSGLEGLDTKIVLALTDSKDADEQRAKLRLRYKYFKFAAYLDELLTRSGKKLDLDHMNKIEEFVRGLK